MKKSRRRTVYRSDLLADAEKAKSSRASYDYKGRLMVSLPMRLKAYPPKCASYVVFGNNPTNNTTDYTNHKPTVRCSTKMYESYKREPMSRAVIAPTYGVTVSLPKKVIEGMRYTDNPSCSRKKLSMADYNKLRGIRVAAVETPVSEDSTKEVNGSSDVFFNPGEVLCCSLNTASKEASFCPTEATHAPSKRGVRGIASQWKSRNHNGQVRTESLNCFDSVSSGDKPLIRRTIRIPKRRRCLSTFKNCFKSSNRRKLPPPPLGSTLGYGIFDDD